MHKLIIKQHTSLITDLDEWDEQTKELVVQCTVSVKPDMEYGTTICVPFNEQVLTIQVSPDYLEEPTIKITLVTKES